MAAKKDSVTVFRRIQFLNKFNKKYPVLKRFKFTSKFEQQAQFIWKL